MTDGGESAREQADGTWRVIIFDGVYTSVEYLGIEYRSRYSMQTFWFTVEI